jgi:hypothetical protein
MSLERDDAVDISEARTVKLGGREFFVPPLSLRQIIAIADHVPVVQKQLADPERGGSERINPLVDVVWNGLRRAHPTITRDDFIDLPMTIEELIAAFTVVVEQAAGKKRPDTTAGETLATSRSLPPTGEGSSLTSASS